MLNKLRQLKSAGEQDDCRQFYLQADKNHAKGGILLFTIPLVSFIFNDYQFLAAPWELFVIITLRLALLGVSIAMFVHIGKIENYRSYDKTVTLWALAAMIVGATVNTTRPQNFIAHVIFSCISVLILYIVIPNKFRNQFALATLISVGEAIIIVFLQATETAILFSVFMSLFFVNAVAIISSWQIHAYRKRSYQDFMKRKELQEELEQYSKHLEETVNERTEKLKTSERLAAIGATAGMVGHDIRNPLTTITGAVYLAKKEVQKLPEDEPKEKLKKNLDLISDQVVYVNKIVADLQDYARPLQPNIEEVDLERMVQTVVSELKIAEHVTVSYQISPEAAKLKTDSAYMKRILTNLINNAMQAMPNGGQLTVRAEAQNGKAILTIEDNGEGIPEETQSKLFTPLVTTKSKGQGFGLAVVKRLTEALGGTVIFDSKVGKGTKFAVELPQQNVN